MKAPRTTNGRLAGHRLGGALKRLRGDEGGVSAVEFALILPLMALIFLGSVAVTQALQADRKVTLAARALSDLASQTAVVAAADMTNILQATAPIMAPFPAPKARATVTGIQIDDKGNATVAWSDTCQGTAKLAGAPVTVPTQLMPPLGSTGFLVLAEVEYDYTPVVAYPGLTALTLSDRLYSSPRIGTSVTRSGGAVSGCKLPTM
jgi:Flp pilus assembly protein TadG